MEGEINRMPVKAYFIFILSLLLWIGIPARSYNQEGSGSELAEGKAELRLRKTVKTRQYGEISVEGEEKVIAPGDSLWRILIQEKGLSEKRFQRYLILVGSLNPQLKNPDLLRIGDVIFIPIRPDEILGIELPSAGGEGKVYRVKRGDYLFKILKEKQGLRGMREIQSAFDQVKKLNPRKKNWNLLFVGEAILLPPLGEGESPTVVLKPAREFIGLDYGLKLPVKENLNLLQEVVGVVGNEVTREGEEELALKEGTIHLDRSLFPVIQNPRSGKKVILNMEGIMTPSILRQLQSENPELSIVSGEKGSSLHEAANDLFPQLGFQSLPSDRPVVLHDQGVGVQVKGEWMVTHPNEGGRRQDMWIISLTDGGGTTPDYLKEYLTLKGMNLKEIFLPSSPVPPPDFSPERKGKEAGIQVESWPRDKKALVDALLKTYQISFSPNREISLSLRQGIRLETKIDRLFELGGRKFGILFRTVGDEVKKALKEKEGIRPIVLELESLSSRQILSRVFAAVGERAPYKEHRFPVIEEGAKDKLVLTVSGFFLPKRSLLLTDHAIPRDLQRFFSEKGLRVGYFQ